MLKIELSDEEKARVEDRQAQEACSELQREERRRREWCVEKAVCLEDARQENIVAVAERIYAYVYGARS